MEAAIDTIPAQGTWSSCDFHEGMSAASMYIEVQLGKPSQRSNRIVKQFCKEPSLALKKKRGEEKVKVLRGVRAGCDARNLQPRIHCWILRGFRGVGRRADNYTRSGIPLP